MFLAQKLKEILGLRDITQAELAKRAELSPSLISAVISGDRKTVSAFTIEKISNALNISPDYFFESNTVGPKVLFEHMTPEERIFFSNPENTPWIKLTLDAAKEGLSKEEIREAIEFIKRLKKV